MEIEKKIFKELNKIEEMPQYYDESQIKELAKQISESLSLPSVMNNQKIIQQKMKTAVSEVWLDIVRVSESEKPHELLKMYRATNEDSEFRLIQTWFEVIG